MKKLFCIALLICLTQINAQIITTVAGNGTNGYGGDGGQATDAELNYPYGSAFDAAGNLYIVDTFNSLILKINASGIITTIAGNGTNGYSGDGGQATDAVLNHPDGVAVDMTGNLYVADENNDCIRKINTLGIITTIAGDGTYGYSGDGGQATLAKLYAPSAVVLDGSKNIYIVDKNNNRVRKINTSGIISTVAGNGSCCGFSGDGGQATSAQLYYPSSMAFDAVGNFYIADVGNMRIRMVNTSGIISTVAGSGFPTFGGDGGNATACDLYNPNAVAVDNTGNLFITDQGNSRIRMVNTLGIINTVAGNGINGFNGDGGLADTTSLNAPNGITADVNGNLYIADTGNNRIRKVTNIAIAGIKALNLLSDVSIYPNPSNGSITISSTNNMDEITVRNILGQIVYQAKPTHTNTILQIDHSGVYFISVTTDKEINTKKILVNN